MIKKMTAGTFGLTESVIKNDSSERLVLEAGEAIEFTDPETKYCKITFRGSGENAGGYININKYYPVLAGSTAVMELTTPVRLEVELVISAESTLKFDEIEIEELSQPYYLASECSGAKDVLVVVPNYPSFANLYLCAFAHSRNKEYQKKGIHIQVASILASNWYEMSYELEGIPVLQGNYGTLKQLLDSRQYHVIVTHFVDENLMSIYDGYVYPPDQLIFICHGAESIYRYVENLVRPYFTRPLIRTNSAEVFDRRDAFIKKYSQMDNAEWVFVSKWLKEFAEEQHRLKFKNSSVINNVINEQRFPYHAKNAEDRKKIIIIRKFDNCMVHSLDLSVRAILELSRKEFFKELSFEIYGDGDFYEVLTEPLRQFENVHFHRTFIPNDKLSEIYKEQGIALLPSRHDAHPVSMGECASSGLVVIGSRVTSNGYFMQEERFHTLADPEDPLELAQIIERLYYNPEEYLKISRELSEFTRENFCVEKTVEKEIELIRQIEINIDYILMLVKKYHDTHCEDKEVLITINKAIDASPELRSKKQLIETFIAGINDVDDVMNEWHEYVVAQRDHDLNAIITEEKLKPEDTRKFMENAFRDGEIKTAGTDIDKLMPPISRFGGDERAEKKQGVIDRLKTFFEKYFGIGGSSTFTEPEHKTVTYDLSSQETLSMVAEPKTPYGE